MDVMDSCVVCQLEASLVCQRCRDAYCSSECQKTDWPHHKLTCFPMPTLSKPTTFPKQRSRNDLNKWYGSNVSLNTNKSYGSSVSSRLKRDIAQPANSGGCTKKTVENDPPLRKTEPIKKKIAKQQSVDVDSAITSIKSLALVKEEIIEPEPDPITTMDDIEIVTLPSGQKLFCLDYSNIAKGFISACINDVKAVAYIDSLIAKISDYCNRQHQPYSPIHGEVCLCKFEDGWYRAVVSKVIDSSNFEIALIDYGNVMTTSSKGIRKIPKEYIHPCLTNKCYIKDFPQQPTKEYLIEMATFFEDQPLFEVTSLEKTEKGVYEISLKQLENEN